MPDVLAHGPATAGEVAAAVQAQPRHLRRVLRGLAAEQVLDELPDGRFALTETGELLVSGAERTMRGAVLARGRLYYPALVGLRDAVRTGATPFELVHGSRFFDHLDANPAESAAFQASMAARSHQEAAAIVAAYDFSRFGRLVDVGGGPGVLLSAIVEATPGLEVLLFDRPEVVTAARLPAAGGDFFTGVPPDADAYLLSRMLHDWDDGDAVRILRSCRRAMHEGARLLVVQAVLPVRAADDPAAIRMDLHAHAARRAGANRGRVRSTARRGRPDAGPLGPDHGRRARAGSRTAPSGPGRCHRRSSATDSMWCVIGNASNARTASAR